MNTLRCSVLFTSVCPVKTNEAWLSTSGSGLLTNNTGPVFPVYCL